MASEVSTVEGPTAYGPAPPIAFAIKDQHRQSKIKFSKVDGKQADQGSCKLCTKYRLTQKKPAYLCTECGDFFCHDTLTAKNQRGPRCCFYAHLCIKHIESGVADSVFELQFENWNARRVKRCKEMDGK